MFLLSVILLLIWVYLILFICFNRTMWKRQSSCPCTLHVREKQASLLYTCLLLGTWCIDCMSGKISGCCLMLPFIAFAKSLTESCMVLLTAFPFLNIINYSCEDQPKKKKIRKIRKEHTLLLRRVSSGLQLRWLWIVIMFYFYFQISSICYCLFDEK